ncbi:winged helix-turn-helix transcriptional regulator [bacterium]|nr:winged helix-turn-helix transcriptional regulator [bacterium]
MVTARLIFAALADETRLSLLQRLSRGPRSITQLSEGSSISRQAVTKHLKVMQEAGLVRCSRQGRESVFQVDPTPLRQAEDYLNQVSAQWDEALARLKAFVED